MPRAKRERRRSAAPAGAAAEPPAAAARRGAEPGALPLGWLLAIAGLAFVVRAVVAVQVHRSPLFEQPQLDSLEFLLWARSIGEGEWLRWHATSHAPGYPFLLALLLALGGGSLLAVSVLQGALGGATCALAAALGGRLFGDRRAGLTAGVLLALYWPLVYVEVSLFAEGCFVFLLMAALGLLTGVPGAGAAHPQRRAAAAGLLLGLAAVVRATALPAAPLAAGLVLLGRTPWPRRAAPALLAAWLGVVAPVVVLVRASSGSWLPVQSFGGLNLYLGNRSGASGTPDARRGGSWDLLFHAPTRAGVTGDAARERWFAAQARREIAEQPLAFVAGLARKALWLVQADEIRDMAQFFRARTPALRWLPGFAVLLPLAVWGGWLLRRRFPPFVAMHLALFVFSNVALVVSARYRIPLVPVLAALAGGAVVWLVERLRARRWRDLAPGLAVLAVSAGLTQVREHAPSRDFAEEWAMVSGSLQQLGRFEEAEEAAARALASNPRWAHAWVQVANLRGRRGDAAGAEEALRNAVAAGPDYQQARYGLGAALQRRGDLAGAERELRHAVWLDPGDARPLARLAEVLLAAGRLAEARTAYGRLAALEPGRADAWLALARLEGAARRPGSGAAMAAKAAAADPSRADAWVLLAMLSLDAGQHAAAAGALDRAAALMGPDAAPIGLGRAMLARSDGRRAEADRLLRDLLRRYPADAAAAQQLLANAAEQGRRAEAEAFLAAVGTATR